MVATTNELRRESTGSEAKAQTTISDDPQVIQVQIERTRSRMGHTIDEIQERLSPKYLKQQTQETIRESTIGKVEKMAYQAEDAVKNWRTSAMETVRENPLPVAMIGIGVGWLLVKGNRDNDYNYRERPYGTAAGSSRSYISPESRYVYYEEDRGMVDEARERVASTAQEVQDWVGDQAHTARQKAQEKTGEVTEQVQRKKDETIQAIGERVDETGQKAREATQQVQRKARLQMYRTKRTFLDAFNENPLAIGAATLAAGALVGLALPGTTQEDKLVGEARDQLVEEAKSTAQQTARKVQKVAQQAQEAAEVEAKREAKKQDLPVPESGTSPEEKQAVPPKTNL